MICYYMWSYALSQKLCFLSCWDLVKAHLNDVEAELKNHLAKEVEMRKSAEKVTRLFWFL